MISAINRSVAKSLPRLYPSVYRRSTVSKSASSSDQPSQDDKLLEENAAQAQSKQLTTKTVAQADAEMMRKMAGLSGGGGEAGVEYEDGKAVAMKRSVRNNMFRLI